MALQLSASLCPHVTFELGNCSHGKEEVRLFTLLTVWRHQWEQRNRREFGGSADWRAAYRVGVCHRRATCSGFQCQERKLWLRNWKYQCEVGMFLYVRMYVWVYVPAAKPRHTHDAVDWATCVLGHLCWRAAD
jgi:hypothetical protein